MRKPGFFSCAALVQLAVAIAMLAAAMATRAWISGSYRLGQLYLNNFNVGLFTVSVDGVVYDRRMFFQSYKEEFQTTAILESFGGGLLLVATASYILFLVRFSGGGFLLYLLTSVLSGIFLLAGSIYFRLKIDVGVAINMNADYSWYLSIMAAAFSLSSLATVARAIRRGEFESQTDTNNVTTATSVKHIPI